MDYSPTPQLVVIVALFALAYSTYVVRKLRHRTLDLYDFPLLLTLGLVPLIFVGWPTLTRYIGEAFGVALPLTVMFGLLFVSVFLILHRLISRLHRLEAKLTRAVQEAGLLSERVLELGRSADRGAREAQDVMPPLPSHSKDG